jgi:2-polyprenyl-6-hydroxyphenyl methylase/3-demethylubiquinone-9 3-methyltransferase
MKIPLESGLRNKDELYLYGQDTDDYSSFANSKRINQIINLVKKYSFGKKILDIGCAQGNISTMLAEEGFEATALDLNPNFLNYAKKKRAFGNISYICASALKMPFKDESFDAVVIGELIEHVAYPEKLLQEARRVLKLGGLMAITTPNNHLFLGMLSGIKPELFEKIKDRNKLLKRQFGPAGKDHLFVFDKKNLNALLERQDFKIISEGYIDSFLMNPFTYYLLKFIPDFLVKIPFLNSKLSLGLYAAARRIQ